MTQVLKQSTGVTVRVGPAVDATDGFTQETTLDITTADDVVAVKADGTVVDISLNTFAAITGADGMYDLTLDTTDVDTCGTLDVYIRDVSLMRPILNRFQVVEEAIYAAFYDTSANLATQVTTVASDLVQVYSDTTRIHSDSTAIHSDTTRCESKAVQIYSDTAIIYSDTTIIYSKAVQVYSDTTLITGSGALTAAQDSKLTRVNSKATQVYSDTTAVHSDTTAVHTQTTTIASDLVQVYSDTTTIASDLVQVYSDTTAVHSDTTAMHLQTTTIASDLVIVASDLLQVYSDSTIIASDLVQIYSDTTVIASDTALATTVPADPSAIPVLGTATIPQWIAWFGAWSVNKVTIIDSEAVLRNSADSADLSTHALSDNGTTFTNGAAAP